MFGPQTTFGTLALLGLHYIAPIAAKLTYRSTSLIAATVTSNRTGYVTPGLIWISPGKNAGGNGGGQIIKSDGSLIWADTSTLPYGAADFFPQTFNGQQYSTYWNGDLAPNAGYGYGQVTFLDNTYTKAYVVCVQDSSIIRAPGTTNTTDCQSDLHEARMTSRGTLLTTGRTLVQHDLTYLGGPADAWVQDSVFYEVDIATSQVLFRWSPLDHLDQYDSLAASEFRLPPDSDGTSQAKGWDYFHMNSVAEVPSPMGGYLVSSRPLSSIFKLDNAGNIEWVIGGKTGGNFTVAPTAGFAYQHDAVPVAVTQTTMTLSVFDNASCDRRPNVGPSAGLVLIADTVKKTVKLVKEFSASNPSVESEHAGSMQLLPNNGALVAYGGTRYLQEYGKGGKLVNAMYMGSSSYRAFKYAGWVGKPAAPPDVASFYTSSTNVTSVYMSWNGDTRTASWSVEGVSANRRNFETKINLPGYVDTVQAQAYDAQSNLLGSSASTQTTGGPS